MEKSLLNKKNLFVLISFLCFVPSVFLIFLKIRVVMELNTNILGIPISQSINESYSFSYFANNKIESILLILVSLISLIIAYFRKYKYLWFVFGGQILVLIWSILGVVKNAFEMNDSGLSKMIIDAIGAPKVSVYPREGIILMILGVIFLLAAIVIKEKDESQELPAETQIDN